MVVGYKKLHSKKSKGAPSIKEGKVARSSKAHKQSESRSKALSSVYSSDFVLSPRCSKGKEKNFCSFREVLCLFFKGLFSSHQRRKRKHSAETGRSMLEMLAVLSLVGILSLGGIAGYRYAVHKMWANETISELNTYVIDVSSQFFSSDLVRLSFGNIPSHTRGGYSLRAYQSETPGYFGLEISQVPQNVCRSIVEAAWRMPDSFKINDTEVVYQKENSVWKTDSDVTCLQDLNVLTFEFNRSADPKADVK